MKSTSGGVLRRAVATGASAALAVAGLALAAAPAHAAPVTVTGTLTDAAGNAIDGRVQAFALQGDGSYAFAASQYVADGAIALPVEPGTYKFEFGDDDGAFLPEFYNDKASIELADPVAVTAPVALAPVVLANRPSFTGTVVSPSGRPVENAFVSVIDQTTGSTINSGITRPDGTYRVGAPSGTYKVRVSASGFATEYYDNVATLEAATAVPLGAADAQLPPISLQEGTTVSGRVSAPTGGGLERVQVVLQPVSGSNTYYDYTDAAGNIAFKGVRPGTYKVLFSDPLGEYLDEWWNDKPTSATADVLTIGLGPVVGLDAVLAPDPANVPPAPGTVDLAGQVVDSSGKPVVGASVAAWDTPADGDRRDVESTATTDRTGAFVFTDLETTSENAYKLYAADNYEVEEGAYSRLPRWYGGAQTYAGAGLVGVPTGGATITLPLTGGISGVITSESSLPVRGASVTFFDADANPSQVGGGMFGGTSAEEDGTYSTTSLRPGTYKVLFNQETFSNGLYDHAPEWYDDTTFAKAKTITVKSGQTVTGIDAALSQQFKAVRKPEIRGNQYLGGKLRAYSGVWAIQSGTTYLYEWLIGDTVVGTGRTYEVTKAAKNKRITLRVLAENGDLNGTALVSTQVIKKKPKVTITIKGSKANVLVKAKKVKPKKFKGTVVVKKIVRTDEYGAPVYKKIGKAKLRNGTSSLTLKKLTNGKNKLVFFITLKGGKYGDAEVAKTVKVKG